MKSQRITPPLQGILDRVGTFMVNDEEATGYFVRSTEDEIKSHARLPMLREVEIVQPDAPTERPEDEPMVVVYDPAPMQKSFTPMPQTTAPKWTDADEAKFRGQWLHDHGAPKEWVVLTEGEVAEIRRELAESHRTADTMQHAIHGAGGYIELLIDAERLGRGVHSCSATCQHPMCVLRRENGELRAALTTIRVVKDATKLS